MKRTYKNIFSLLLMTIFALCLGITAFADDSSVTYEGGAEKFVFLPGSEHTDSDLFDGFKGVMPGDVLTETIEVKNSYRGSDYVKIYMKAVLHDETENSLSENVAAETDLLSMQDFLSQLSMTVWDGNVKLYEASPDELDGLAEYVLLGSFPYGTGTKLTVELQVPIELDNKYADAIGEVDWVFAVEERNNEKPTTGDGANAGMWIGVMVVSMAALIGLVLAAKHRRDEKK